MIKKIVVIISSLIILILLTYYLATGSVNLTPYFSEKYYDLTRARLDSAKQEAVGAFGRLKVGMARINITPTIGMADGEPLQGAFRAIPLAGYGDREGRPAEGVHDSLYIRVIAMQVEQQLVFLVGCDILIMPPEVADSLALQLVKEHNINREQLFLSATHTHSSFGAWASGWVGSEFAGEENIKVRTWFTSRLKASILSAQDDLKPARVATMSFSAPHFVKKPSGWKIGQSRYRFYFYGI